MLEHTGLKTARRLVIALGTTALILAPGTATGAVTENVDRTISIPVETRSGFIAVDDQKVEVPGVRDVTIRIQATGSLGDPVLEGPSAGTGCTLINKALQIQLAANGTGLVTLSYTTVASQDGTGTPESRTIPFGGGHSTGQPRTIQLCFR